MSKLRIMLIGFGVVGQSFAKILSDRYSELVKTYGVRPQLVAILDRRGAAINEKGLDIKRILSVKQSKGTVANDSEFGRKDAPVLDTIENMDADVVVESTLTNVKTGEPGLSHIMAALKSGKHVITTNKGPLAVALPALMELAQYNDVHLRFSGTVGGGTPVLDFAKKCLLGDRIVSVRGILNGTTNYILSRMTSEKLNFEECLAAAQKAGYAEADPSMDIDGLDAACKLVIIANWIMNLKVTLKDVDVKGIRNVALEAIDAAEKDGCELKLIGSINNKLEVKPQPVHKKNPLCVSGVLNAVTYASEHAGEETIVGKGAGGVETASAVLRDLIAIKRSLTASVDTY
ncbi:MAG: homoserine dehydrogenase [Candidatus Bathyarchaeota archaeon]